MVQDQNTSDQSAEPDSSDEDDLDYRNLNTPDGNLIEMISDQSVWPLAQVDAAADFSVSVLDYIQDFFDLPGIAVSVLLARDDRVQQLNHQFRGKNHPTNVLSFPALDDDQPEDDEAELFVGDIAIGFQTVTREAREMDRSIDDHIAHLLVHAVLHLLGYDHHSDDEAGEMEALESAILARFDIDDPYRGTVPIDAPGGYI